jgi:exonuclease SbcD
MTSGNHDSARRLGVGARIMERVGIHLRTDPATCHRPAVLADRHGEVAVYGLPYLEPALTREEFGAVRADHTAVLGAAMDRVRADLAQRPAGTRAVVLAHAFVTGAAPCDSERDITAGGVQAVPAALFDGADYVALGHLHGCQTLSDRIRYSGSPLAYSFSEEHHRKSMWLVDLGATGEISAERVYTPAPRPLARLRGTLKDLLADPGHERHTASWVEATLTDANRPHEPKAALAERFPYVIALAFEPDRGAEEAAASYARRLRGRSDQQIAEDFVAHVRGAAPADRERAVLREALDAVRADAARTERV